MVTAVSKRYAIALFEYAKEKNIVDNVLSELKDLVDLYKTSDEFKTFIKNPLIKKSEKEKVIKSMADEGKLSKDLMNFLLILVEKGRLVLIEEIYNYFRLLQMEENGEVDAYVKLADEYDDKIKSEIKNSLEKITNKKVNLNIEIDKSILGGFIAQVKSNLYDVSISGQLRKLKETLLK
ncbi:ATP synthase F1 subunit delta [Deferribacter thermophilus]|uniref:ATP synthase F1 subunit delta n=1 Tax=Deferribacter thermophilus TaxID=53573 RepID=UPI003C162782